MKKMRSTGTGSLLLTAMIMVLLVLTAAIPVSGLCYWEQVSEEGFGDLSNDYAWSMAVYKPPGESTEYLYVGTLNTQYSEPPNLINDGCEIWRTDGTIVEGKYVWEQVVGPNGTQLMIHPINGSIISATAGFRNGIPGIHGMVVYDGLLWAGGLSTISGIQIPTTGTIWVTNGTHWRLANIPGFGDGVASIRGMAVFNDELYVGTLKFKGGLGASIYKYTGDPIGRDINAVNASAWTEVFSVAANEAWWFGVLKVFNGYLYAFSGYGGLIGDSSPAQGCEIYRTSDGTNWEEVVGDAPEASMPRGFGDDSNDMILCAAVFQDKLYAGTKNYEDMAEIWRTSDGLNWEPVEQYGFGRQNRYIWRMIVYNDMLIAGTLNTLSGCEAWMSETGDPGTFEQININGMDGSMSLIHIIGNMSTSGVPAADQYGVRSVAIYQGYLVAGTATWADLFVDKPYYYYTEGKWHNLSGYVGCEIWRTDGTTYDLLPKNILDVIKTVWDPEAQAWVQELDAVVNDTMRFRCEIRNIGSANLTDIVVRNRLSRNLEYADRATIDPAWINVSSKGKTTLEWDISYLSPGENIAIEYDANVTECVNKELNFLFARGWSKDHWDTDWDMVIVNSTAIPECT